MCGRWRLENFYQLLSKHFLHDQEVGSHGPAAPSLLHGPCFQHPSISCFTFSSLKNDLHLFLLAFLVSHCNKSIQEFKHNSTACRRILNSFLYNLFKAIQQSYSYYNCNVLREKHFKSVCIHIKGEKTFSKVSKESDKHVFVGATRQVSRSTRNE